MLFRARRRLVVLGNYTWRSVPADTTKLMSACQRVLLRKERGLSTSAVLNVKAAVVSGIGCHDLVHVTGVWNVLSRKCFSAAGHWSGAKRVAKMMARLMTFGTAFMPVAFVVPTMTIFHFALLGSGLVASVVVARFGFFATVDNTSPRDTHETDGSTGGSATPRGAHDTDDSAGGSATLIGAHGTEDSTGGSATLSGAHDTDDSTGGSATLMGAHGTEDSTGGSVAHMTLTTRRVEAPH